MNTLFPGRDNYTGPNTGVFGLLHHDTLCESSHDVMERVDYVKKHKPKHEVDIRLHNMIYLGNNVTQLVTMIARYNANIAVLYADYEAKRGELRAEVLEYIKLHIPDCTWNGKELVFPRNTP